jgi:hypothetical protein
MKPNALRISLPAALALLTPVASAATLDDIQFWVGSGGNRAALVIDWKDGQSPESLLWGFRWDGTATGLDMLQSVVNADPRLFAHLGTYVWGTAVLGLGYDLNHSGSFGVTPALTFNAGGLSTATDPNDARLAADSADHWREGWNNGFWAYYLKDPAGGSWTSAMTGAADRILTDGAWDGFSFAPGFAATEPSEPVPAAVPEPGVLTLLTLGALVLLGSRRGRA